MKKRRSILAVFAVLALASCTFFNEIKVHAAYNHDGDVDSINFRMAYPAQIGTKLDSCTLCHRGGSYTSGGKTTNLGSCQWCHYVTNYDPDADESTLLQTLNPYGLDYKNNGRTTDAFETIKALDSDGDGYPNGDEIIATRFPGDKNDDPTKVPAPSLVLSLEELEQMAQHTQFLLMNASKSDDSYTEYLGIALESLINAIKLDSATSSTVYAPDGFATLHPFNLSTNPNSYHVFGTYPQGTFYYDEQADMATNPSSGWCNYSSLSVAGRENGSAILNPDGLKMLLAFKRDGEYLSEGVLNDENKLDGEGPFRIVPPQKNPGPPDQRSTAFNATDPNTWVWPYDSKKDHNAGFSTRTATIIKVEPLPSGTTDINTMEAGWPYVDQKKVIVYGSIDPYPLNNLNKNLEGLLKALQAQPGTAFKNKSSQKTLVNKIEAIEKQVAAGAYSEALSKLKEDVLQKMDGYLSGAVDANDWIIDLRLQQEFSSKIKTIWIGLVILGG